MPSATRTSCRRCCSRGASEARRAAILESSLDAVVAMDEGGRITEFNRAAEHAFGFTRAEVLGRDLFETIIPQSYRESLRRGFARYLTEGGRSFLGKRLEATARRHDDREFAVEVTVSEIRLDPGREFTAHIRDITERKQYEERLRLERESVETLHRITSSFAAKLDLQALIQDVIDAATECSGAEMGAFFYSGPLDDGQDDDVYAVSGVAPEVFDELRAPRTTALLAPAMSGRSVLRLDDVTADPRYGKNTPHFGPPSGHPTVCSLLAVPVVTGSGTMLGTILLGHAQPGRFTERHESVVLAVAAQAAVSLDKASLYRAAQEARHAAELANRTKDEFLATLSHELRTPLTAILGWCQLLTRGKRSEAEIARGLERIESSAQAQTRLISDLLDVSRIVSGKLRLEVQPLDLEPVIEAAIEAIRPPRRRRGFVSARTSILPRWSWRATATACSRCSGTFSRTPSSSRRRAARSRCRSRAAVRRRCSASATTVAASARRTSRASSTASARSTAAPRVAPEASASVSRSCAIWSSCTAAPCVRRVRARTSVRAST